MIVTHRRQTVIALVICLLLQSLSAYGCVDFNQSADDPPTSISGHCHSTEASDQILSNQLPTQESTTDAPQGHNCDHCHHGMCGKTTSVAAESVIEELPKQRILLTHNQFTPLCANSEPPQQPPKPV